MKKAKKLFPLFLFINLSILFNPTNAFFLLKEQCDNISFFDELKQLEVGDILFCEWNHYNTDPGWDHVALYIGNNSFVEATPVGEGVVRISELEWFSRHAKDICFGHVKTANQQQRLQAVTFALSQIGKSYQYLDINKILFNRSKDPNPESEAWYCTELVWASYYHQEINIDLKGPLMGWVMPSEICWDNDVEMYTQHRLNSWHPGMYVSWFIYILNNPRYTET